MLAVLAAACTSPPPLTWDTAVEMAVLILFAEVLKTVKQASVMALTFPAHTLETKFIKYGLSTTVGW